MTGFNSIMLTGSACVGHKSISVSFNGQAEIKDERREMMYDRGSAKDVLRQQSGMKH